MIRTTCICLKCNKEISKSNYKKHITACNKRKDSKLRIKEEWYISKDQYQCPYCQKIYCKHGIAYHIWANHTEEGKDFVLNRTVSKEGRDNISIGIKKKWKEDKEWADKALIGFRKRAELHLPLKESHRKSISQTAKANGISGGYREGTGRGKKGWYESYWCASSWELAYVVFHLDHNIIFERNWKKFPYEFEGKIRSYIPDFREGDSFIEIKGFMTLKDEAKHQQFSYELQVLGLEEMKPILDYVINEYGEDFLRLYEAKLA